MSLSSSIRLATSASRSAGIRRRIDAAVLGDTLSSMLAAWRLSNCAMIPSKPDGPCGVFVTYASGVAEAVGMGLGVIVEVGVDVEDEVDIGVGVADWGGEYEGGMFVGVAVGVGVTSST